MNRIKSPLHFCPVCKKWYLPALENYNPCECSNWLYSIPGDWKKYKFELLDISNFSPEEIEKEDLPENGLFVRFPCGHIQDVLTDCLQFDNKPWGTLPAMTGFHGYLICGYDADFIRFESDDILDSTWVLVVPVNSIENPNFAG